MSVGTEGSGPNPRTYSRADYAALEAECERVTRLSAKWQERAEVRGNRIIALEEERDTLAAELEAARKQSPIGHVALGSHTGVVFYSHMPQLPDGTKLYALPPLAGQVSVRRELLERVSAVLNRLDVLPEPFDEAAELRALLAGQQADGCPICKQRNYIQRKIDEAEA